MTLSHVAHHDPNSSNYGAHVVELKKIDYCIGCLGSRIFLIFVLPLLHYIFIYPNSLFYTTFDYLVFAILWIIVTLQFGYEIFSGREIHSTTLKLISDLYLFSNILYVALVPGNLRLNILYMLIFIFSMPQIIVYLYKSISKNEFHHTGSKLIIRLLFISGLFFVLNGLRLRFDLFLFILMFGALIFVRMRSFSDMRVNDSKFLFSTISLNENSKLSGIFRITGIFDNNGQVKNKPNKTNYFKKILGFGLLGFFYIVGLVIVTSNTPTLIDCATKVGKTPVALAPWIILKSSNQKFCSNCGEPSPIENSFCEQCGTKFTLNPGSNQNISQEQNQGYQDNRAFGGSRGYDPNYESRGYYPPGAGKIATHRGNDGRSIPIIVGIVVGVFVLLATGNPVLAVILGVVAGFGVTLAMSSNNPCLSYCIISQCIDCICSATAGERRRGGKL